MTAALRYVKMRRSDPRGEAESRQKEISMKYDTYLFDFDGTLVDSMPTYIAVMLRILDEQGVKYAPDLIKIITPLGYPGTARYYVEKFGLTEDEGVILERMKSYAYGEYAESIPAKEGVIPVLRELKSRGASLNILTASPHRVLDVCLERLGILDLFDNVWSCDDFGTGKSDPEIYRAAAGRLRRPVDRVLFLDDNCNAVATAASAGMAVCGVYDASSEDYTDEIKGVSEYYIRDFSELLVL